MQCGWCRSIGTTIRRSGRRFRRLHQRLDAYRKRCASGCVPLLHEIVIAEDGYPLRLQVPDPVAFTLHKCWVAEQPDRRVDNAKRDRLQAIVVADLVKKRMPALGFDFDRIQNLAPALLDYLEVVTGGSDFSRN